MKTILITGGLGQIGRAVLRRLSTQHRVICVDIVEPDEEIREASSGLPVSFHTLDLRHDDLTAITGREQVDTLIHLASIVGGGRDVLGKTRELFELNLSTALNILKACPAVRHVVFSSSMTVYGAPQCTPIDEDHPTVPQDLYALSKLLVENALRIHAATTGITLSILRFTSIYGPGKYSGKSATRAIPNFIRLAKHNESPRIFSHATREKRDYLFIDDAAEAIVLTVNRPFNDVVNIGSGKSITILELAETIVALCGAGQRVIIEPSAQSAGAGDYLLDIEKAKALIDFVPRVTLEQGLRAEIAYA